METLYKASSGILVNGKHYAFPTFASMVYMDGQNMMLDEYLEHVVERPETDVIAYTVAVPTSGWVSGSLNYGGTNYTRKCVISVPEAMANPVDVQMKYAGGDYSAYCKIGLVETGDGQVTLWAQETPESTCQIRVIEIRKTGEGETSAGAESKYKRIMIYSYTHSVELFDENGKVSAPEEGTIYQTDYLSITIGSGNISIMSKTNGQLKSAFAVYDDGTGARMAYKTFSDSEPLSMLRSEGAVYIVHFTLA